MRLNVVRGCLGPSSGPASGWRLWLVVLAGSGPVGGFSPGARAGPEEDDVAQRTKKARRGGTPYGNF